MTGSTSDTKRTKTESDPSDRDRDARLEDAQKVVEESEVAKRIHEADEKGYFGDVHEDVPNEAFTVRGVTQDPERAAVSGRPHVARALGRDLDGTKKAKD